MSVKKRIGIMGGTFNPIHYGHLLLAESALWEYELDEVWFMPSGKPAYKSAIHIVAAEQRKAMVEQAISGNDKFFVSTVEMERKGNTYTIDTMKELMERYPEFEYYFLIGADSLLSLETWNRAEELMAITSFIVALRNQETKESLQKVADDLVRKYSASVGFLSMPKYEISSSDIRDRVLREESIRYMVPEQVRCYIQENGLYREES